MATFLSLTNMLLRRLNEVEIEQSDFVSVRGVQALAKDAINSSIRDINTQQFEWPFNAATRTETMVVGQVDYTFPANLKVLKWDSFVLLPDSALGVWGRKLETITRDQYLRYVKTDDDNADPLVGRGQPRYAFPMQGFGVGFSPMPDEAYQIYYEYFIKVVDLEAHDDEPTVPDLYIETIIQGGLYHMYMFRDNTEQASVAEEKFRTLIKNMRTHLINIYDRISSTQIERKPIVAGRNTDDYFN